MNEDMQDAISERIDRLFESISGMAEPQRSQLAVVCAAHMRPAVGWAKATRVDQFDGWIRRAWEAAATGNCPEAKAVNDEVAASADAVADEPTSRESLVARALIALQYACDSVCGDGEAAAWAFDAAVGGMGEHSDDDWDRAWAEEVEEVEHLCAQVRASETLALPDKTSSMLGLEQNMTKMFGAPPVHGHGSEN